MKVPGFVWTLPIMAAAALVGAPPSQAEPIFANYQMNIPDRFDFHTWTWMMSHCQPAAEGCVRVKAIPMPNARAYQYGGEAHRVDGRYTLTVDVPDGLRCGNVYYGPIIPTRDVYSWDATTLQGTMTSSFAAGCDGAPGTLTYPFWLSML